MKTTIQFIMKVSYLVAAILIAPDSQANAITSALVNTLPVQKREDYQSQVKMAIQRANENPNLDPGKRPLDGSVFVTPIVFQWVGDDITGRPFSSLWRISDKSWYIQELTDRIQYKLYDRMNEFKYGFTSAQGLNGKGVKENFADYGSEHESGSGYFYVHGHHNTWGLRDYRKAKVFDKNIHAGLFVRIQSIWTYKSHSKLEGEAVVNYDVSSELNLKYCYGIAFDDCIETKLSPAQRLVAVLPTPSLGVVEKSKQDEINSLALDLAAEYYSGIIVDTLNRITD